MKPRIDQHPRLYILTLAVIICVYNACKKKDDDPGIILPQVFERVTEIIKLKGGLEEFKEVYHYEGNKLSSYYLYMYDEKGEWDEWLRYIYEYPEEGMIVETRQGITDTNWFNTQKWEKRFSGDQVMDLTAFTWRQEGSTGSWMPVRKNNWLYEQGRLTHKMISKYENAYWVDYAKRIYEYTGNLWTAVMQYIYVDGEWDTIYRTDLVYGGSNLTEVLGHSYYANSGWSLDEQFLLEYEGDRMTKMHINESFEGNTKWDRTISLDYNENGNPTSYLVEYNCCPDKNMIITYESGKGNLQQATTGNSDYLIWPWLPAPL